MTCPTPPARQALVSVLRRQVEKLEGVRPPEDGQPLSTGVEVLDRLLPGGGLRRGSLVEYLTPGPGSGAGTLALSTVREACREGGAFVVVDRPQVAGTLRVPAARRFYPPAAAAGGIDLSRMLLLRPANEADALWALDQALRCPGVAAVWAEWDWLDVRDFRRLQLAAESGRTLGILIRPARLRGQPTWAEVQWEVRSRVGPASGARADPPVENDSISKNRVSKRAAPAPRGSVVAEAPWTHPTGGWRLMVELVRCRGAAGGKSVQLELDESAGIWREATDHATHPLHLPAELADPAPARRA